MEDKLRFFDSHAHYYDDRFYGEENEQGAEALLKSLFADGLLGVINVGTNSHTNRLAIEQAKRFPLMYAAVGLHPEDMAHCEKPVDVQLAELRSLVENAEIRRENKIVAIGEIGLDYYWEPYDKVKQMECFKAQLELARELDMPVIIHDREAHGDCLDVLRAHPRVFGVFHSFSGSLEMARELLRRDFYISFSGTVTFKNAQKVAAVAAAMPHDRTLIETDAPYLAPHPHRGELNHSGLMRLTASRMGELWGVTPEEAAAITAENARRLFLRK